MRIKPETLLIAVMSVFALTGVAAMALAEMEMGAHTPIDVDLSLIEPGADPSLIPRG